MKRFFTLIALLFLAFSADAALRLPHVLSSDMVLQQQTDVSVWGFADPGQPVTVSVSWNRKNYKVVTGQDSCWMVKVPTPAATFTPQSVVIKSRSEKITLDNILIGEVWVCSGQSNMEMPLRGYPNQPVEGADMIINGARESDGIRVCRLDHTRGMKPEKDVVCYWRVGSSGNVAGFTAVGYTFAKSLQSYLNVPVGIIDCSWGGAPIHAFLPKESFLKLGISEETYAGQTANPEYTIWSAVYYGMICPISSYTVKGFLWYQGCSNVGQRDYSLYQKELVSGWRRLWGNGGQPFYYAQIAPYDYGDNKDFDTALLREQQALAAELTPDCGMISTVDLVYPYEEKIIHPRRKVEIGRRFADMAACRTYGFKGIQTDYPQFESMELAPQYNAAILKFKNMDNGFWTEGGYPGFELAGEDKAFYPADTFLLMKDGRLAISSSQVEKPVAVRYLYKDYFQAGIWNTRHLPLLPFRTDNWNE
ncbi:MAG: sialate O-acetylesterase [Bacteroidales bacterium]|nr:sialate O-acetylesterase [Candidatus Equibacterium intestinale]